MSDEGITNVEVEELRRIAAVVKIAASVPEEIDLRKAAEDIHAVANRLTTKEQS